MSEVEQLRELVAQLLARVAVLEAENAELRARLGMSSKNSHQPPSTDSPFKRPPPQPPSGRKPGGQRGHKPHRREMLAPTEERDVLPCACRHCGEALGREDVVGEVRRHQVVDVEIRPVVRDYVLFQARCRHCRRKTKATLPVGVPAGVFGPHVEATVALLTMHGISRLDAVALMKALFGVRMAVGSVQKTCERVDASIADAVQQVADLVGNAAVVHADETGWHVRGKLAWMWVALCKEAVYFRHDARRNTDALCLLLGLFDGVVHSDRWKPYELFSPDLRQLCHAHLRRDIQAVIDRGGADAAVGKRLLALSDAMFHEWHGFERKEFDADELSRRMAPIQAAWKQAAAAMASDGGKKTKALGVSMLKLWPALWNFVEYDDVVPTNNEAEREIRRPVKVKKATFGSTSEHGAQMVANFMTVFATARRQGVELYDWLVGKRKATLAGVPGPALLLSG